MNDTEHWALWLNELRGWVKQCLAMKEVWQVRVLGDRWVCPYCTKVLTLDDTEGAEAEQVASHLVDSCGSFEDIGIQPTIPAEHVRYKALGVFIKHRLTSSAAWQMRTGEGEWVCPYCAVESGVKITGKLSKELLVAIIDNVAGCQAFYQRGFEGFLSVDEIKVELAQRVSLEKSIDELTSWMTDD